MEIVILGVLVLTTAVLAAYTINFQFTTFRLDQQLVELSPRMGQNAITPRSQNVRNILYPCLFIYTNYLGFSFYGLAGTASVFFGCFLLVSIIRHYILPKAGDSFYIKKIQNDLVKRRNNFQTSGDIIRAKAVDGFLKKVDKLFF